MANYFSWDCTSDTTSLGPIAEYFSGSVPGSSTTRVIIDGTPAMRYTVIGNDGGNQQMGAEVGLNTLPFNYVGGLALYYRWCMRIDPGFRWGSGTAKVKSSRTAVGPVVDGTPTGGQGYTGYLMSNGFLIGECDDAGCSVPGGGANNDENHIIPFDFRAMADGHWREYVVKVKANTTIGAANGEFEAWVNGVRIGSANGFILRNINPSTNPPRHVEGWGSWMTMPYFQLNGTASDGGTIYCTDFSVDDVFNSRLIQKTKNIGYYICNVLPPESVKGKREYRSYIVDWLRDNTVPGTWQRTTMLQQCNADGTFPRNFCVVLVDADESVHTALASVSGVQRLTSRNMAQTVDATERNRIRTILTNRGLDGTGVQTGMTYSQVMNAIGPQFEPSFIEARVRG